LDLGPRYVLEFRMYLAEPHLYSAVAPAKLPVQVSASSLLGYAADLQVPSSQLLLGSVEHCFVNGAVSLLVHYSRHNGPSEIAVADLHRLYNMPARDLREKSERHRQCPKLPTSHVL